MDYTTLSNVISRRRLDPDKGWTDWPEAGLTPEQRESLYGLLAKRCRDRMCICIRRAVKDDCRSVRTCGLTDRVHIYPDGVQYCAGQSYPDELRTLRNHIAKFYE